MTKKKTTKKKQVDKYAKTNKSKYFVDLIESERGWGSSCFATKFFNTEAQALKYMQSVNAENNLPSAPDYYIYATKPELIARR